MSSFYGGGGGGGLSKKDLDAITSKIFKFKIVTSLPTEDISDSTIYLINTGEEEDNFYTEYVYVDNNWEKFGTQKVDLSNYVSSQDLTLALETKADKEDIPDISNFIEADADNLTNYYNKNTIDNALNLKVDKDGNKILTDINYSAIEQEKVNAAYEIRHSHDNKTVLDSITAAKIQAWDAAEQNVNADWTAESGDAQILHKPDLSVYALAANVTKSALGIDNVDNTSDADKPISTATETALAGKVDKETGKSLMTSDEHTKLNGIEAGAQVNVQSDWEQNNSNADDFIKNKPANLVQDASYVHTDNNFTNAEKAKADGAIQSTEKGTAGGVAELDEYGHVPVSQLPSFVSDVIEGYYDSETTYKFYADAQHQTEIQGQSNKIYVDVNTNLSYRWSGSVFAEVSPSLALGSTDSTAYRGDWGTADHAAIGILASLNTSEKSSLVAAINELQSGSVSVDPDRGLSENDFTDSLKSKLDGIESGAEVNVQSDWNQTVTTADDFIKNKPENLVQDASYVHTDNNYTTGEKTKLAGISAGAQVNTVTGVKGNAENDYRTGDINISPANIGLGNVNNTSDANKPISTATQAALNAKQDALTAGDNVSIATVNGVLTISATDTDTTYSAGTGLLLSGTTFSNSAPNVKSDWNAAAGTDAEILNKPTIPTVMAGAAANAAGRAGLVPAPAPGDNRKFLRGDGTWVNLRMDQIYPVGSIYMSVNSTSPSTLFGGTWERLKDTFLLAAGDAYSAGATGGEAAHLLTNDELPADMGSFSTINWNVAWSSTTGIVSTTIISQDRTLPTGNTTGINTYNLNGGGQPHNNMPPYLAVYMWKRTA